MAIIQQTNNDCRTVLWLDRDLIKIIRSHHFNLNEELRNFFKCNTNKTSGINTEITFDSFDKIQRTIRLLHQFNDQLNAISNHFDVFCDALVDIGMDMFYEGDNEYEEEDDDNACDRLSDYYGALHEYLDNQKEGITNQQKADRMYRSVRDAVVIKKIAQIQRFYHIHDTELNKIQNVQTLINFLIYRIDNNKDIVYLLNYKKIYNKFGKQYTAQYISKQRYRLKLSTK